MKTKFLKHYQYSFYLALIMLSSGYVVNVNALSTDKNQPAVISADDIEFDFTTGLRTYRGNVKLDQGTMKLRADKLIVEYKNDVLQKATAFGKPAIFQQRPDGKKNNVIGKGRRLELDEINNIVTLHGNASLKDGDKNAKGTIIIYDMDKDNLKIKGGGEMAENKSKSSSKSTKSGRSKIVISAKERKAAEKENVEKEKVD